MHPLVCSPVPLKVLESLVLNKIGSITTRTSNPYQFAYKAKRSTLDAVSCPTHAINSHLHKGRKGFRAVFLDFNNAFNTQPRQGLLDKFAATNPPYWLVNGSTITSLVVVNIFGRTIRYLARSQTTVVFIKVQFFLRSFSPSILPIFSLNH